MRRLGNQPAAVFGAAELSYRFLPWLGGIATALLAPVVASRLFSSRAARFLMVVVIALHPSAIDLARDKRTPNTDYRRTMFPEQIGVLEKLNPDWARRCAAE